MDIGNRVFYFVNKALTDSSLRRRPGAKVYNRLTAKVVRIFQPEHRLSAIDIEKMFGVGPGHPRFNSFYIGMSRELRAVIQTKAGECFMIRERIWDNGPGDDEYIEIVPNSIDFLYGDD